MNKYDSSSVKVLTGAEAVRKRPGMFFGKLNEAGVNRVLFEVIANSIDQYLAKHSTMIRVEFEDDIIRISDDGKGLPFDKASPENSEQNLVEYYFTTLHTSATADLHVPHVHVNLIGVGLAAVNAVCENISVTSFNGQKKFNQRFGKGKITAPLTVEKDVSPSGTLTEIRIDEKIFGSAKPDLISLRKTLFEIAHFYPGLIIHLNTECFCAKNGLLDLAQIYYQGKPANSNVDIPTRFSFEGQHEKVWISAAAIGQENTKTETQFISWVNGSATVLDGVHVQSFKKALHKIGWKPSIALIHTIMHHPKYAGPSKDAFTSTEAGEAIEILLHKPLKELKLIK